MNKIVIAKEGYDATTETNPNNLIFSSDYNTFKYHLSGTDSYTITSGSTSGTHVIVTHNLGYIPFFMVYGRDGYVPSQWYMLPYSFADAGVFDYRFVYATTTQIVFSYSNSGFGSDVDIDFAYKVFKNNLLLS